MSRKTPAIIPLDLGKSIHTTKCTFSYRGKAPPRSAYTTSKSLTFANFYLRVATYRTCSPKPPAATPLNSKRRSTAQHSAAPRRSTAPRRAHATYFASPISARYATKSSSHAGNSAPNISSIRLSSNTCSAVTKSASGTNTLLGSYPHSSSAFAKKL